MHRINFNTTLPMLQTKQKMKIFINFSFAMFILINVCAAQIKNYYVSPDSTYPGITTIHNGHFITMNTSNASAKKLLISIPGTTGTGDVMRSFDSVAALEGFIGAFKNAV